MSDRPRLLDLFCGAGGAARGYQRAGFHVTGVDHRFMPRYAGDEFVQADVMCATEDAGEWRFPSPLGLGLTHIRRNFVAIHASPCQAHSSVTRVSGNPGDHPDLIAPTRALLRATGLPYVIENVAGAPLLDPVTICGSTLGLDVRRHRLFETNWPLLVARCSHGWQTPRFRSLDKRHKSPASVVGVHGHINYAGEREIRERAMGIDWMTPVELVEAIPPAMTELIGHQLAQHVRSRAAA